MSNKDQCIYCGREAHGTSCEVSPSGVHVIVGDENTCRICGSSDYGYSCILNTGNVIPNVPATLHVHGHGGRKCIYCGNSTDPVSAPCMFSPTGHHQY